MDGIEEDKIANEVLEDLPPSFLVFGTKKDLDPLEEFWMNKLSTIEQQYDQHVVELERKLLTDRAQRRSVKKQSAKITKLKEDLKEQTSEIASLKSKTGVLKGQLKEKDFEAKSLHDKLNRANTVYKDVIARMAEERQERMRYAKECTDLRNRLKRLEKEKTQLMVDVDIKESEKARVEEREDVLHKERLAFVKNISDVDAERRIQTSANIKLCQDIEKLLGAERSLEIDLLKERQVMDEVMEDMKVQRKEHQHVLRQLDAAVKSKRDAQDTNDLSFKRISDLERNTSHLKEESRFLEAQNLSKNQEIRNLKRRNSRIRCMLADTKHKLNGCLSEMKSLENEKRRADVDLENAKRQEKALQLEMKKNELRKCKLAERILKTHPFLLKKADDGGRPCASSTERSEIESYKKRIWKLERHKDDVERKVRELQRKENIYRIKLDKYSGMEKQIYWTGKAMAKVEDDRQRLEHLLKTMESNMPIKVPFKKLVTDPSVLDRLAKNKVLQKRLFQQAEKMEELKLNARRLLQFREEQFGAMDRGEDMPIWKLSYLSEKCTVSKHVLSGLNIDIMKQPSRLPSPGTLLPRGHTEEKFLQNYMQQLNYEIPKLREEISHLEAKKLYIEMEKETQESHREKLKTTRQERIKLTSMLLANEQGDAADASDQGESDDGLCTPEMSIHGSSYDDAKAIPQTADKEESRKIPKIQKQAPAPTRSSSTEDQRDDVSSEGVSDIPSDKSFE